MNQIITLLDIDTLKVTTYKIVGLEDFKKLVPFNSFTEEFQSDVTEMISGGRDGDTAGILCLEIESIKNPNLILLPSGLPSFRVIDISEFGKRFIVVKTGL